MWGSINKDLLPMKAHYFLFNAGTAPVQPFMTVYAKQLGFSSVVVGIIYGILPVVGMFSKLLVGALADKLKMRKTLFLAFLVLGAISFFGVQFVPEVKHVSMNVSLDCGAETNMRICTEETKKQCMDERLASSAETIQCFFSCDISPTLKDEVCKSWKVPAFCNLQLTTANDHLLDGKGSLAGKSTYAPDVEAKLEFTADVPLKHTLSVKDCLYLRVATAFIADNTSHIPVCNTVVSSQCSVECTDGTVNQLMRNVTNVESDVSGLYQFWLLFWLLVLSWIGMAVVVTLSDAICFELLGDRASDYGTQRLWGSIGWGLLAIISGLLVDYYSEGELEKNYTPAFYLLLILWGADLLCSTKLKYEHRQVSRNIWADVGGLLVNPRIVVFMLSCIVVGMCTGLQWSFLFWYLEELSTAQGCGEVVWIKTLQGLASGVQCFLGELPYFFLSGFVLQKLGHVHCMSLILFCIAVRLLLYSALTNAWWTLPIELLQGVYGLFYPTMASYANAVAPPGTEATVQGLVGAVFEGVGVALGSFLAGLSYGKYAGATTFRLFGIGALVACFLHVGLQYWLARRSSSYTPKGFTGLSGGNEAVAMLEVT